MMEYGGFEDTNCSLEEKVEYKKIVRQGKTSLAEKVE
jgi:hypothetical protein